jgi:hypothetical protein
MQSSHEIGQWLRHEQSDLKDQRNHLFDGARALFLDPPFHDAPEILDWIEI